MNNVEKAYKECNECEKSKELSQFWKKSSSKDGHAYKCIECSTTGRKDRICDHCNNSYSPKSNIQRYCSLKCRRKYKTKKASRTRENDSKQTKVCNTCDLKKDISNFYKHKTNPDGYTYICKECDLKRRGKHYISNKEETLEYQKKYREENKELIKKREKRFRQGNLIRLRREANERYQSNKDEITKRLREKYRTDTKFRLNRCMSSGIYGCLKENKKGYHWEDLVPYTIDELKKHLEPKFKQGMSWDNYGEWHIDHIIPKSKFNFSKPEHIDFQKCWSLENLQPLWASENIAKRDTLKEPFQPSFKF